MAKLTSEKILKDMRARYVKVEKVGDLFVLQHKYDKTYIFPICMVEVPCWGGTDFIEAVWQDGDEEEIAYFKLVNGHGDMLKDEFKYDELLDFVGELDY